MKLKQLFLTLPFALFSFNANATVITFLDGVNYEWQDMAATAGMSRVQVEAALTDANSNLYGYQYASRSQVESLLHSYADRSLYNGDIGDPTIVAGVQSLVDDFGELFRYSWSSYDVLTNDGYTVETAGYYGFTALYGLDTECPDTWQYDYSCAAYIHMHEDSSGNPSMAYQTYRSGWNANGSDPLDYRNDIANPEYGSFLVRTAAVPIPAAVWLFGSALAGLGWVRRKQTT